MIILDDILIPATVEQILKDIKGNGLLTDITDVGEDIMVTCPIHSGGQERNASCGVLKEDRGEYKAGTVHCYTCGYTNDIVGLVNDVRGFNGRTKAKNWLVNRYLGTSLGNELRPEIPLGLERGEAPSPERVSPQEIEIHSKAFNRSTEAREYMINRDISLETCNAFKIGYKPSQDNLMIPIADTSGDIVFYKERGLTKKHFYNAKGHSKSDHIFGIYRAIQGLKENPDSLVWICESEIDALTVYDRGGLAISIMGSHISSRQLKLLESSPIRKLVDGLDRDQWGRRGSRDLKGKLVPLGIRYYPTKWSVRKKDINELTREEFTNIKIL